LAAPFASIEAVEDEALFIGGNPTTAVAYLEHKATTRGENAHLDASSSIGELDRVRDEIVDQLREPHRVGIERWRGLAGLPKLDACLLRPGPKRLETLADEARQIDVMPGQGELARIRLGDEEEVGDQVVQAPGVSQGDLDVTALLFRQVFRSSPPPRARGSR
jgi:hypothetical protein